MNTVTIIGIILLFVFLAASTNFQKEHFVAASNDSILEENTGKQPWNRHPINSVAYLQLRPAFQRGIRHHANAAYFEVDNHTFDMALQKAFRLPCGTKYLDNEWFTEVQPDTFTVDASLLAEYHRLINYISKVVSPYQVVHDRWISFRSHVSNKTKTMLRVEMLLYRTGRFQGKHITLSVIVDTSKKVDNERFTVVQTNVDGVVPEDAIGMHPVVATSSHKAIGVVNSYATVPSNPLENYPSLLVDQETIAKTIQTQNAKLNRDMAAQLLII